MSSFSDSNRTILVTGANGGIGLATTLEAARRGWRVVATSRSQAGIDTIRQATTDFTRVTTRMLNVDDAAQCEEVISAVQPYAVVNNAGFSNAGAVEDITDEMARAQLETMVVAPTRIARLCIPHMRKQLGGRIINVSSLGGRTTSALTGWYTACKHSLEALSDALRVELAADDIKVSLIEPGGVSTGILQRTQEEVEAYPDSRYADSYRRALSLTRLTQRFQGDASKVAATILDAVEAKHPKARYLVGTDARLLVLAAKAPSGIRDRFQRVMLKL